jgi:hypothetical protein
VAILTRRIDTEHTCLDSWLGARPEAVFRPAVERLEKRLSDVSDCALDREDVGAPGEFELRDDARKSLRERLEVISLSQLLQCLTRG